MVQDEKNNHTSSVIRFDVEPGLLRNINVANGIQLGEISRVVIRCRKRSAGFVKTRGIVSRVV